MSSLKAYQSYKSIALRLNTVTAQYDVRKTKVPREVDCGVKARLPE
jgi:hypothetical protein